MNSTVNLLVDYKDRAGRYFHKPFQVLQAPDEETVAACVMEQLQRDGYTACAIAVIYGSHTMEALERMQDKPPVPGQARMLYMDRANY